MIDNIPDATSFVIDKTLSKPDSVVSGNMVALPILQSAAEAIGNPLTANIIAAGAANALLGIAPDPLMEQAVRMHIPWGNRANQPAGPERRPKDWQRGLPFN